MTIKILTTIGPASLKEEVIKKLDKEAVSLFRINMSHTPLNDVEKVIASIARVPIERMNTTDKDKLRELEKELTMQVFGQEKAIKTLVQCIKRSRAGLHTPDHPIGSFPFHRTYRSGEN